LALAVASAGIQDGQLTIGVVGAQWASRLRYSSDAVRKKVAKSCGLEILSVRIRVVAPLAAG
jgi:Dna[CI] antecedent, DciA